MKRLLATFAMILLVACSGDNGTAPPNDDDDGGGGTVTQEDSVWVQTVQAIAQQMEQWAGESPDTVAARAVAYLKSLPSIANAGISPGTTSVWGNFKNGYDLIIPNNREASSMADTLVDAAVSPAPRLTTTPRKITIPAGRGMTRALRAPESALDIPVSQQFRVLNAIGPCFIDPAPGIRAILTAGHYVNAYPPPPTVAGLKSVHGDGVFYINSHGGLGVDINSNSYYGVWTLDRVTVATAANYRAMMNAHELVVMFAYGADGMGNCTCVGHYGFTDKFVRAYMEFEKNSLVIVDACQSGSADASKLRDAFEVAGASAYLGWTRTVEAPFAYRSMKYLLDRLLGINLITPEDPEQRAFNINDVLDDMATNRNMVIDPAHNSALTPFPLQDDFGLLSPSIQFVSLESFAGSDQLLIAGMFGTDPGEGKREVTINGESLSVTEWHPDLITCEISDEQAGTVKVKIGTGADPRESNPVNLTSWEGTFTYEHDDPGSLEEKMEMKVHIKADIHSFRDKPHEPPFETTVLFNPTHDSSVKVTTSGSYSQTIADCTDTFTQSKGADIKSPHETTMYGSWIYFGSVDSKGHQLRLAMQALAAFDAGTWKRTGDCEPFDKPLFIIFAMEKCIFDDQNQTSAFLIPMGDDFTVSEGNRGSCEIDPLIGAIDDQTAHAKIRWTEMKSRFPPDPKSAR